MKNLILCKLDIEASMGLYSIWPATMQDNLQGRITALKSALEGLQSSFMKICNLRWKR
jgi:hypothetical protein